MARRKISNSEELLSSFINIHVPKEYLDHFDVVAIKDKPDYYEIILHEKEDHIPLELHGKKITLDGFCNPTNILTHTFSLKRFFNFI